MIRNKINNMNMLYQLELKNIKEAFVDEN